MTTPAWAADAHDPRTLAGLTKRCPQCAATPDQHCRPYNRNRIVHEQRVPPAALEGRWLPVAP